MTDQALAKIAHIRALMLGSSSFPPAQHLAYLEQAGPHAGTGFSPVTLGDLTLREVDPVAERTELVRVVAETLLAFGQVGRMLAPASVNAVPGGLIAAELVWFGIERDGALVGLHGGFFWSADLWVRRFYAITPDPYPWDVHFAIESHVYGHLWDQGMRQAMIQIPAGTPNLDERLAAGWVPSHEVHFQHNARPFLWLRRRFEDRPHRPAERPASDVAWRAEAGGLVTRELTAADAEVAGALIRTAVLGCRLEAVAARTVWRRWMAEALVLGTFAGEELIAIRVYDRGRDADTLRQRATCYAPAALDAEGLARPAVVRAAVAFLRARGVLRVVATLSGTAEEQAQKERVISAYGGSVITGVGGARGVVFEVADMEDRARAR